MCASSGREIVVRVIVGTVTKTRHLGTKKTKYTIGRDRGCDVPIADDSVSRVHAELSLLDDGRWLLRDCQSRNGTKLIRGGRSKSVREEVVAPGDGLQFGSVTLRVDDLLDVLRPRDRAPSGAKAPPKLVRCECGMIKPSRKPCPECGQ